jgi:NADPH:quinone reductase
MKPLRFDRFGLDALRVEAAPRPTMAKGQALVQVKAAGLNSSDLSNVQGRFSQTKPPRTPGRDGALAQSLDSHRMERTQSRSRLLRHR